MFVSSYGFFKRGSKGRFKGLKMVLNMFMKVLDGF